MALSRESFSDLAARMVTGFAVALVGLIAVWLGHPWFTALVVVIVAALVWELARMLSSATPEGGNATPLVLGLAAAVAVIAAKMVGLPLGVLVLIIPPLLGALMMKQHKALFAGLAVLILLAGFGLSAQRDGFGVTWMLWLVLLVAVTDIAGYFAGRIIGGPKFWPRVSPKKTWSGTTAGWICAALVGWAFMASTGAGPLIVVMSVVLAMASQAGDVLESAVKRHVGVKDSSNLLPGHGGVWDRFDGLLGASLALLMIEWLAGFPPPPSL